QGITPLETMVQVMHEEPVSPRRLQPGVPRDLETVCLKCLEKEPRRRFPDALALAEDLRRYRVGEPILGRRTGAPGQVVRWCRRRPGTAALVAALAVALLAGFVGVTWGYLGAERARRQEALAREGEAERREQVEAFLYFNRIVLAQHQWLANDVG